MKCKFNLIGLIALIAVTMFSMAACDGLFGTEGCGCCDNCSDKCKGNCCTACTKGTTNPVPTINLTVTNNTGLQGRHLYVDPSSSEFSASKLGATEYLNNGLSKTVVLPAAGNYNIRIVTENENVYTKYNQNITSSMTITFTAEDIDTNPNHVKLTVTNNTGYNALLLQVTLSSVADWGSDKLDAMETLDNGQSKTIVVEKGTYDIRITDDDPDFYDTYSKMDVDLYSNTTITFTGADIDREDAYGTFKLTNNADGLGIYRVDILGGGVSVKPLWWLDKTGFTKNQFYEFHEYNFTYGTYGLRIMQYVEQDGVYVIWEKKTPFTIIKNRPTHVTFDKGNDWINKTENNDSNWPSNDVWASYGLPGFQKPAGASVINIGSYVSWYHFYSDYLYVTLDAGHTAFMDLKNQIDILALDFDYDPDLDEEDAPNSYILKVWTSDFNDFLTIDYSNYTINIEVSKRSSLYGIWEKGNYMIIIDFFDEKISFIEGGNSEQFENFYYSNGDSSITVVNWQYDIEYFSFNISREGNTLTVTGMPSTGDYVLTGFNGVYTKNEFEH